jgi:hypothetical protein
MNCGRGVNRLNRLGLLSSVTQTSLREVTAAEGRFCEGL